jgi:hypothetical protein
MTGASAGETTSMRALRPARHDTIARTASGEGVTRSGGSAAALISRSRISAGVATDSCSSFCRSARSSGRAGSAPAGPGCGEVRRQSPQNSRPRRASVSGARIEPGSEDSAATASRTLTAATGRCQTSAQAFTAARPTRSPVNDPGPTATAKQSTSESFTEASCNTQFTRRKSPDDEGSASSPRSSASRRASERKATLPWALEVSMARIFTVLMVPRTANSRRKFAKQFPCQSQNEILLNLLILGEIA